MRKTLVGSVLFLYIAIKHCNAFPSSSKRFLTPGWVNPLSINRKGCLGSHRFRDTVVSVTLGSTITSSSEAGLHQDDVTTPNYVVEPIPIRIGHGFDIHRMAPLEEAGQPLVIAGVIVEHGNQKWLDVEGKYVPKGSIYETQLGVVAHSDGMSCLYYSTIHGYLSLR